MKGGKGGLTWLEGVPVKGVDVGKVDGLSTSHDFSAGARLEVAATHVEVASIRWDGGYHQDSQHGKE